MSEQKERASVTMPPFETAELRRCLTDFLDTDVHDPVAGIQRKVGNFKWGVYAFFDYDREPIYVGQTNEMLRVRIRRHLTNQRTDAVAMSVLDPFEVYEIEVWPLPQFQNTKGSNKEAKAYLDALEHAIYQHAISNSKFGAILNEKNPPLPTIQVEVPRSIRGCIVSPEVYKIRNHPDSRIARRALIISRLAQVISERQVRGGLRRVLLTQAKRLQWLAEQRYMELGGPASVETENGDGED